MQKEVISDMSHHNSFTFSADFNTTEAKGFALHSDLSEACFGGRGKDVVCGPVTNTTCMAGRQRSSRCCISQYRVCSFFWGQSRALGSEGMKSLK